MAQLMPLPLTVSCFGKIPTGTFLVLAHPGSPDKGPLNVCVCERERERERVCVCVCSLVRLCVCVSLCLVTRVSFAETTESVKLPSGLWTRVDPETMY